jgi:hypothetical protein
MSKSLVQLARTGFDISIAIAESELARWNDAMNLMDSTDASTVQSTRRRWQSQDTYDIEAKCDNYLKGRDVCLIGLKHIFIWMILNFFFYLNQVEYEQVAHLWDEAERLCNGIFPGTSECFPNYWLHEFLHLSTDLKASFIYLAVYHRCYDYLAQMSKRHGFLSKPSDRTYPLYLLMEIHHEPYYGGRWESFSRFLDSGIAANEKNGLVGRDEFFDHVFGYSKPLDLTAILNATRTHIRHGAEIDATVVAAISIKHPNDNPYNGRMATINGHRFLCKCRSVTDRPGIRISPPKIVEDSQTRIFNAPVLSVLRDLFINTSVEEDAILAIPGLLDAPSFRDIEHQMVTDMIKIYIL